MMHNMKKLGRLALFFSCCFGVLTLGSCSKGTDEGDVNVERSEPKERPDEAPEDIKERGGTDPEFMDQGRSGDYMDDTEQDSLEKFYDHTDHKNHSDNDLDKGDGYRK